MPVFLNDRVLPDEAAMLHVNDLSMQRGYAVFDFLRADQGRPLFLPEHLQRLFTSVRNMHLSLEHDEASLTSIIRELLQQSPFPQAGIRIMVTGGYAPDHYHPVTPNLLVTCNPLQLPTDEDFDKGMSVITYAHQRELPHIKTINYQVAIWLQPELKKRGAADVLYTNNGILTEFPRANVFIVTGDGTLATPLRQVLPGITRGHVLQLAGNLLPVQERDITETELLTAAEVFLTSTTRRLLPVLSINGRQVGNGRPGPVTRELYNRFRQLEAGRLALSSR